MVQSLLIAEFSFGFCDISYQLITKERRNTINIKEVALPKPETPTSTGTREPIQWAKSTCPHCGIGCGIEVGVENGKVVKVHGMKGHPINNGKICHLAETLPHVFDPPGRLTQHMIRYDGGLVPVALREAITHIATELRRSETTHIADVHLQIWPGTDVALNNGIAHVLLKEGFVRELDGEYYASGLQQLKTFMEEYPLSRVSKITGCPEDQIIRAARAIGRP